MQNSMQKYRQRSTIFEKPGIFSEKLRTLTSSTTLNFNNFCSNFAHTFILTSVYKSLPGIFFTLFRTWVICQKQKRPGYYTFTKQVLSISQDLSKI